MNGGQDFEGTLEQRRSAQDERNAEQWVRAVFEGAPAAVRAVLALGWRLVLGLRLGPRHDAAHVLGWRIAANTADRVVLRLDSWLLEATNEVRLEPDRVIWTTHIDYRKPGAQIIWALALPIHKLTITRLLKRAATTAQT